MTDEEIEIIPILDDVLVAGDLDKAVTGDIDLKDLESIETFDALFEASELTDSDPGRDEGSAEAIFSEEYTQENHIEPAEELITTTNYSPDTYPSDTAFINSANDGNSNPLTDETATVAEATETSAYPQNGYESNNQTGMEEIGSGYSADNDNAGVYQAPDFTPQTSDLPDNNPSLSEQPFEGFTTEQGYDNTVDQEAINYQDAESSSSPEYFNTNDSAPAIQLDTNVIIEKVVQEIMPELETKIRHLILAALEKHLSTSLNNPPADTEDDTTNENRDI